MTARGRLWTRRDLLKAGVAGGMATAASWYGWHRARDRMSASTFIARVESYEDGGIAERMQAGFRELGIDERAVRGKRILLKPNLVEPHREASHINTHPHVVRAAIEMFRALGAESVVVAEGAGHIRDSFLVLERSGLAQILYENKVSFVDLNIGPFFTVKNGSNRSPLGPLTVHEEMVKADLVVSLAKMKTHHWAGVTLSMKNLFGALPGTIYGWPKNVLHWAGITESILDINASLKPDLAIVDGIVGMEGDGPIMGDPVRTGVLVMGRNLTAVDATCCRIMGVPPERVEHLKRAAGWLGPVKEARIEQRGETIASVQRTFRLVQGIPAQSKLGY